MSNLIELVLGARMAGGWENEMGWILSDHKFVPTGPGDTPKTGDTVLFDAMSNKWALKPPVPVPFTPPQDVEKAEPLEHEATDPAGAKAYEARLESEREDMAKEKAKREGIAYIPGKVPPEPVPDPEVTMQMRTNYLLTSIEESLEENTRQLDGITDLLVQIRDHMRDADDIKAGSLRKIAADSDAILRSVNTP